MRLAWVAALPGLAAGRAAGARLCTEESGHALAGLASPSLLDSIGNEDAGTGAGPAPHDPRIEAELERRWREWERESRVDAGLAPESPSEEAPAGAAERAAPARSVEVPDDDDDEDAATEVTALAPPVPTTFSLEETLLAITGLGADGCSPSGKSRATCVRRLLATLRMCEPGQVPVQMGFAQLRCVPFAEVVVGAKLVKTFVWAQHAGQALQDDVEREHGAAPALDAAVRFRKRFQAFSTSTYANVVKAMDKAVALDTTPAAVQQAYSRVRVSPRKSPVDKRALQDAERLVIAIASNFHVVQTHLDVLVRAARSETDLFGFLDVHDVEAVKEAGKYFVALAEGAAAVSDLLPDFNEKITAAAADVSMANVEQGKPVTLEEIYLEYCTAESLAARRSDSSVVRKFGPVATAQTVEECVTDTQHIHAFNMFAWATLGEFHQLVEKSCPRPPKAKVAEEAPAPPERLVSGIVVVVVSEKPFGLHIAHGTTRIVEVDSASPADRVGVSAGCELVEINGTPCDVSSWRQLFDASAPPFPVILDCKEAETVPPPP